MSKSNFAPDFPTLSRLNDSTNSFIEKISCSVPGFHPKNESIFINASEIYPLSRYPELTSPVSGFFQSVGNTGNPSLSPSLLLNFPFPSGFKIRGKCANSGVTSSQPKYLYNKICNGADGNHSSPLIT